MKILLLASLICFGSLAQAQVTSSTDAKSENAYSSSTANKIWINIGPGFSNVSAKDTTGVNSRTGLMMGAELELPVTYTFSVQTGLDYVQKGFSLTENNIDITFAVNYLEIPVLAKLNVPTVNGSNLSFKVGPYAAFAVARSASAGSTSVDTSGVISGTDFGARLGAAYEIPIQNTMAISMGLNYDLGLKNLSSKESTSTSNDDSVTNRTLMAAIGLGVKL